MNSKEKLKVSVSNYRRLHHHTETGVTNANKIFMTRKTTLHKHLKIWSVWSNRRRDRWSTIWWSVSRWLKNHWAIRIKSFKKSRVRLRDMLTILTLIMKILFSLFPMFNLLILSSATIKKYVIFRKGWKKSYSKLPSTCIFPRRNFKNTWKNLLFKYTRWMALKRQALLRIKLCKGIQLKKTIYWQIINCHSIIKLAHINMNHWIIK
jgi:hypothetical protein